MKKSITGHELAVELLKRNQNYKFGSSNTNHLSASMREIAHQTYLTNIILCSQSQHYHNNSAVHAQYSLLNQLAYLVRKISSGDMYVHSLRYVMCVFTNKCRPESTGDVYVVTNSYRPESTPW